MNIRVNSPLTVIEQVLSPILGKRVLEVGCGAGGLAHALVAKGALVTGVDPNADAVLAAERSASSAEFLQAGAEALPFADRTFDAVVVVNTLHHVPIEMMDQALQEMARTTTIGGHVIIIEPLAQGSFFEALRLVEDETVVRAEAQIALARAVRQGRFVLEKTISYVRTEGFNDIASFLARIIAVDPSREILVKENLGAIVEGVRSLAGSGGRLSLDQPIKADILRPIAI